MIYGIKASFSLDIILIIDILQGLGNLEVVNNFSRVYLLLISATFILGSLYMRTSSSYSPFSLWASWLNPAGPWMFSRNLGRVSPLMDQQFSPELYIISLYFLFIQLNYFLIIFIYYITN